MEHLIEHGPGGMTTLRHCDIAIIFARAFELTVQIERGRFFGAGLYDRTAWRQGDVKRLEARAYRPPAGTATVQVPKNANHEGQPFYPHSVERGHHSVRVGILAVTEMYVKDVSTRVQAVMREFGIEGLSSTYASRAARLPDNELAARPKEMDQRPLRYRCGVERSFKFWRR